MKTMPVKSKDKKKPQGSFSYEICTCQFTSSIHS